MKRMFSAKAAMFFEGKEYEELSKLLGVKNLKSASSLSEAFH